MPVKRITSRENPLYREILALAENRQSRKQTGRTLLDGEHLLAEAGKSGLRPVYLVMSEDKATAANPLEHFPETPAIVLPPALFGRLSPVATPTGVLAVMDVPRPEALASPEFILLLEDIQDPGNLGSLLRTAAAAGIEEVHLSKGCAEAWSPKTLRGGQGGHFGLRIHEGADLVQVARSFPGAVFAAALRSCRSLYDQDLRQPVAFAFGNEGAGLSAALLRESLPFSIPMTGAIESLNVAAAAAICLFERVRQTGGAACTS